MERIEEAKLELIQKFDYATRKKYLFDNYSSDMTDHEFSCIVCRTDLYKHQLDTHIKKHDIKTINQAMLAYFNKYGIEDHS